MVPTFAASLPGTLAMAAGIKRWTRSTSEPSTFSAWRRPWCTDQRDGRTDPNPCPASRDADGLRAAELQHPVQDMDADGDLGRSAAVRARPERVADHPLVAGDRRLGQRATVVPRGLLPADAPVLGDGPEVPVALRRRGSAGPWGRKYPAIGPSWRRAWAEVVPFYAFPAEVRRLLYTTNAIEALDSKLRRAVRVRGHFPTDEAALKLLFLVLNRAEKEWMMPPAAWAMARAQFAVLFGERFTRAMAG